MDDTLRFSTGKELEANAAIIGLGTQDMRTYGGYDDGYTDEGLTAQERIELADYMIAKWTAYRQSAERGETYARAAWEE